MKITAAKPKQHQTSITIDNNIKKNSSKPDKIPTPVLVKNGLEKKLPYQNGTESDRRNRSS